MPRVHLNGADLHYQRAGTGLPVVFVHGGFSDARMAVTDPADWVWTWEQDFARRFDFVWYDRRGCHHSSCPANGYDLENQALDLELLLDHLGLPDAHVVASSAGGPIAVVFAAAHPARVRSLVLVGTAARLWPPDDPDASLIREQVRRLERDGPDAASDARPPGAEVCYAALWERRAAAARGALREYEARLAEAAVAVARLPRPVRVARHAAELRNLIAYVDRDVTDDARRVRVPTLVLHGDADELVPLPAGRALAGAVPRAELRVVPGGPHSLLWRSDEGRPAAIGFVERVQRERDAASGRTGAWTASSS
jgi:pimeloyl-ACP methyl ester carboxylesterase